MNLLKKFLNKNKYYILSFLIPLIILFIAFFIKGVWFDGEKLIFGDMLAQYKDMLLYFKRLVNGSESIFYSFFKGLGGDMYSTTSYYMLSPFNFILLLFKDSNLSQAIYLIILLKISLCGTTMFILLNSRSKDNKLVSLFFSSCYALMAFLINSYFCIMWFDIVYLAPLVILGIDNLIDKNKSVLYIISLALTLISNFCIGFMVCIFSVIYFIYNIINKYVENKNIDIKKIIVKFILSSLIAGLVTCIVWLPAILEILKTNRDLAGDTTNFITMVKTFFINSYDETTLLNYHQPNLYCGILIYVLVICYFFNKNNNKIEKISTFVVIAIFIASILIKQLSYVWHGFSYPIGYNFRFTFLFCLFLIMIAHKEYTYNNNIKKIQKIGLFIFLLLMTIFVFKYFKQLGGYLTIGVFIIYLLILISKFSSKTKNILITIVLLIELSINTVLCFYPAENPTRYVSYVNDVCLRIPNSDNYRVVDYDYYGIDSLFGCKRESTRGFYSTINNNIVNFYNSVGMSGGANVYDYNLNNTPILDSLLGVKYIFSNKRLNNHKLIDKVIVKKYDSMNKVYYEEKNYIYENTNVLEIGYMIKKKSKLQNLNIFDYQNKMMKQISGIKDNVLVEVINERENKNLSKSKYVYIIIYEENSGFEFNGVEYNSIDPYTVFAIENNSNSDYIELKVKTGLAYTNNYDAYYLDQDNYEKAISILKESQLKNIKINKNKMTGNINVKEKGTLMLSIPYEDGWNIYVDGEKVKYNKIYDMFIGIDLTEGKHNIEMEYYQSSFKYGLIISIFSLLGGIAYLYEERKENNAKKGNNKKRSSRRK